MGPQTYSRLDHSLGLFALVGHFAPEDYTTRAAALLHDVGHLPLSHTLEGVLGLDHHDLGVDAVASLAPTLDAGGLDVDEVIRVAFGPGRSALRPVPDQMKLDHFESFLRSGRVRGGTLEPPSVTLSKVRLVDGAVHTDTATAGYLTDLVVGEAQYQSSVPNVVANAVITALTARLVATWDDDRVRALAGWTDQELWAALRECPATRDELDDFLRAPWSWDAEQLSRAPRARTRSTIEYSIPRFYTAPPLVAGVPYQGSEEAADAVAALLHELRVTRRSPVGIGRPDTPGA